MSWAKLDDRANEHEKQVAAGPKACWLWACGLMYCNRQPRKTGRIPKTVVHAGMLFPGLGKKEAEKLVEVGLWHDGGDAYEVHQFHGWNPEARGADEQTLSEKRAEAGRKGGLTRAARAGPSAQAKASGLLEANSSNLLEASESFAEANQEASAQSRAQTRAYARTDARGIHPTPPHPTPGENPPTPLPEPVQTGVRRRDPFALSRDRLDVRELFEGWKTIFGFPKAKLDVGSYSADADTLAECIDAYGMPDCRLVLKHAPNDGMVSGRDDETKKKHDSIRYIFGNQQAFNRILRDAQRAEASAAGGGVSEKLERMRNLK